MKIQNVSQIRGMFTVKEYERMGYGSFITLLSTGSEAERLIKFGVIHVFQLLTFIKKQV